MQKRVKYGLIIAWATLFTGISVQESAGQSLNRPGKTEINILVEDGIQLSSVVIQDVRGRFKSGGDFYPFLLERADGLQTLRWIRKQPWSNGVVSGWGASYVGYTRWAISDSLNFLVPFLTGANLYDFAYPDGVLSLQSTFVWSIMNAHGTQPSVPREKIVAGMQILPLSIADDSTLSDIQFLTDWFTHEYEDEFWQKMNYRGMTKAPLLSVAGWYDIFLKTQIEDFQVLIDKGSSESRMIIGPWCHGSQGYKNEYGGTNYVYDPSDPYPSLGGTALSDSVGPALQNRNLNRKDQLNPDHKLKVVVTSSWFPRFNRNLNGCDPICDAYLPTKATQKVYFGASTPSCINLPVFQNQK
jgi:predicted acyl esterase